MAPSKGGGHEDLGRVADLVLLLVGDELQRVVVRDLPARELAAGDPEVGARSAQYGPALSVISATRRSVPAVSGV